MKWVSINDRLPTPYESVFVGRELPSVRQFVVALGFLTERGTWNAFMLSDNLDRNVLVTHWQPAHAPETVTAVTKKRRQAAPVTT